MILEVRFLTGRYHATAWGRHVNEAVPEWPPSPFRIVRALLDCWYRKHADISAEIVERIAAALAAPPVFWLPPARASHTRSYLAQNSEDPSDKKLVFDGFAVIDRDKPVLIGWPGVQLAPDALAALQTLASSLNYLGRSESWVSARVSDDREQCWNCVPLAPGPTVAGQEVVSIAGVVTPEAFSAREFVVPAKGKTTRKLTWFEALGWGSSEAIAHTMNRPPALEPLFYVRAADALDARPASRVVRSTRVVEAVRFAVDGRVPAPLTDALRVGDGIHARLMGSLRRVLGHGDLGPRFTGRDGVGRPAEGHGHVSILPLDEDRDGYIDVVLLTSPEPFTLEEQASIERIKPQARSNGHPLVLTPISYGSRSELLTLTTEVVSHTPFAPYRHWRLKRDGELDGWLERQLAFECEQRGLPAIIRMVQVSAPMTRRRRARWLEFQRARKNHSPQPAYGLQVRFAAPVQVPFSLGYASHYGLGCFVDASKPYCYSPGVD